MANASDTSHYVLVSPDTTLPNSQTFTAGTGLSVSSGGAGGHITVAADGALANFANLIGPQGFVVYNPSNKVIKTVVFQSDGSIAINDPGGNGTPPTFGVVPQTTNQLIQASGNAGSSVGNYPQINFSGTNGISCSVSADAANNRILVSYSGLNASSQWSLYPAITNVNLSGYKIFNLADPTDAQDAVTKNYVDLHSGGAPIGASYLTASENSTLTNEINLGALDSGILVSTVNSGVATISTYNIVPVTATLQTLNATTTTLFSIPLTTNQSVTVTGSIIGSSDDHADTTGAWFTATVGRSATDVYMVGTPFLLVNASSSTNVVITADTLTQSVLCQVTGIVATTYNWSVSYTSQLI
jgi:hypothetical protein